MTENTIPPPDLQNAESVPTERAVPSAHIVACAKLNCPRCWGKGELEITLPGQKKAERIICRCAVKRFLIANKGRVAMTSSNGHHQYFYKVDETGPKAQ